MEITEKYRPKKLSEVVGQKTAIRQIQRVIENRGLAGSSWWLAGATGTGKTTIARILATEFAENEFTIYEFVGRDVSVDDIREMERAMAVRPMGSGRAFIINEAQDMSDAAVSLLLALVEKVKTSKWDMIVFTAMVDVLELKNDPMNRWRALVGRCTQPKLANIDSPVFQNEVIEFISGVAAMEGIKAADIKNICEKSNWSIRAALSNLDIVERIDEVEAVDSSMESRRLTVLDAVYQVLVTESRILTAKEIAAIATNRGLLATKNKTPLAGIVASIRRAIARGDKRFAETKRGLFSVS